ncbi:MAG: ankyrin repeat domain-containing protein [Isosphaeraceae bacterium]
MSDPISRRSFSSMTAGIVVGGAAAAGASADAEPTAGDEGGKVPAPKTSPGPVEAAFQRDYSPPSFKPSWKKPQINRLLVQDFVIYAHSELDMVKRLLDKEPMLLNATMDWGGGDWESGLGGASHMGRHDIVEYLLGRGARIDIFCAAMMGRLEAVKSFLTLQPALIDARGPHGFTLHFHAQVGGPEAQLVLDYLQSIKHIELKPNPFLKKSPAPGHAAEKGK